MCTCITYNNGDFYFGRNLDLDCSFGKQWSSPRGISRCLSATRKLWSGTMP